jgi:hypothetical protein
MVPPGLLKGLKGTMYELRIVDIASSCEEGKRGNSYW